MIKPNKPPSVRLETDHFRIKSFQGRRRSPLPEVRNPATASGPPSVGVPDNLRPIHRNLCTSGFPYPRRADYSGRFELVMKPVVRLEDEGAVVSVLPWLCGRVASYFDKNIQRHVLWSPPGYHFGNLGLSGAWTLGGTEFNAFRFGHNVHGTSSLQVDAIRLPDGRPGVRFGAFDEMFGASWQVILTLVGGRLLSRVILGNHSARPQPCLYWWTTLAVPLGLRDRIMLAPSQFLHHSMFRAGYECHQWPMAHGADWSRWMNQHEAISGYLADTPSDFMGYVNEQEGWSFHHRADRRLLKGRKLWSLGSLNAHHVWWDTLAEPAWSPYCELQCGLLPVQPDTGIFHAGERIEWTEVFSVTAGRPDPHGDYAAQFSDFERRASLSHGDAWSEWNDDAFWEIREEGQLCQADPRLALSKKVVLGHPVHAGEITRATDAGWVAGEAWIKLLSASSCSSNERLSLAGALLQAGNIAEAEPLLEELAKLGDEAAAFANLLLAALSVSRHEPRQALDRITRATGSRFAPETLIPEADRALAALGLHEERRTLWRNAGPALRGTDDGRVALASLAFLDRKWLEVRRILDSPLPSIGEGVASPWALWKESFLGEFADLCTARQWSAALDALAAGASSAPQFGLGRQEDRLNTDFLFYRYLLCRTRGWQQMAESFAQMILSEPVDYPGSVEALYVLRTAILENDPTTALRRERVSEWYREAGPPPAATLAHALHACVSGAHEEGWSRLADHALYRFRAAHELRCHRPGWTRQHPSSGA